MQPVPSAIQHRLTRFCKPCSPSDTGHYQYPSHFQQAKASRSRKYGEANNVLYDFPSSNISPPLLDSIRFGAQRGCMGNKVLSLRQLKDVVQKCNEGWNVTWACLILLHLPLSFKTKRHI